MRVRVNLSRRRRDGRGDREEDGASGADGAAILIQLPLLRFILLRAALFPDKNHTAAMVYERLLPYLNRKPVSAPSPLPQPQAP